MRRWHLSANPEYKSMTFPSKCPRMTDYIEIHTDYAHMHVKYCVNNTKIINKQTIQFKRLRDPNKHLK